MNEMDALLCCCVTSPGDDAPRLVLADWMEEREKYSLGECPLRLRGYWWLIPDQTRLQVASVVYWRTPKGANRVLHRIGSVIDFRVECAGNWGHSAAKTWMGGPYGWRCGNHGHATTDLWVVGNAVLSAESEFIGNRSARGRFKRRMEKA